MTREEAIKTLATINKAFANDASYELGRKAVEILKQPASPGWEEFRTYLFKKLQEEIDGCLEDGQGEYEICLRATRSFIATIPPPQHIDCDSGDEVQQGGCEGALDEIERMLKATYEDSEYGLTEYDRGWKNALLLLRHNLLSKTTTTEEANDE